MTMQDNRSGQYVQAEVSSSPTEKERLRTQVRFILDNLVRHIPLPYGMTLVGRVTNDHYSNASLYVFLKDRDGVAHPGVPAKGNHVDYIPETVGGHRIGLNKGMDSINYQWEARDINRAVAEYRMATSN
jgi:hypothetical protein